ncbi:CynX/NimT family MFS transporter [Myceligenerans pegani]|uniref:MFS transporter n=1 Tax=Myceligenerans pegani TaxID=2776917 RepID=A0ABR9MTD5_9MICO|nr:MFS transporter [Myceligenerans sp. TRM 65318]MBE1874635.1 MFS transporter [Myceligenerans sp. TRM 65318]MBE3016906.1 MFS transporter [Myceligenerans sp. TRM 65318]
MSSSPSRRTVSAGALLAALLVVGLNFRAPITALPPVLPDVATGLGMSSVEAGLLTGVPILCFALFAPVASWIIGRVGPYRAMTLAVAGVLAGTLLRSAATGPAGVWIAVAGTAVIGAAITLGNVAAPVIVAHDFARRAALATGLYTASLNLGSVFTTTLTVPLAAWLGWQAALAAWSVLAVVALVTWAWVIRGVPARGEVSDRERPARPRAAPDTEASSAATSSTAGAGPEAAAGRRGAALSRAESTRPAERVLRRPITWMLAVAFVGQSFAFFAVTGALPELLGDRIGFTPAEAGAAASLFQGLAILGSLVLPATYALRLPIGAASAVVTACWLSLPLGLLFAPGWWAIWCSLAGFAQGGNFAVIFTLVAQRAGSPVAARRMAATVQSCGYVVAFTGPSVMFAVHDATGGWAAPLALILAVLTAMAVALALATMRISPRSRRKRNRARRPPGSRR